MSEPIDFYINGIPLDWDHHEQLGVAMLPKDDVKVSSPFFRHVDGIEWAQHSIYATNYNSGFHSAGYTVQLGIQLPNTHNGEYALAGSISGAYRDENVSIYPSTTTSWKQLDTSINFNVILKVGVETLVTTTTNEQSNAGKIYITLNANGTVYVSYRSYEYRYSDSNPIILRTVVGYHILFNRIYTRSYIPNDFHGFINAKGLYESGYNLVPYPSNFALTTCDYFKHKLSYGAVVSNFAPIGCLPQGNKLFSLSPGTYTLVYDSWNANGYIKNPNGDVVQTLSTSDNPKRTFTIAMCGAGGGGGGTKVYNLLESSDRSCGGGGGGGGTCIFMIYFKKKNVTFEAQIGIPAGPGGGGWSVSSWFDIRIPAFDNNFQKFNVRITAGSGAPGENGHKGSQDYNAGGDGGTNSISDFNNDWLEIKKLISVNGGKGGDGQNRNGGVNRSQGENVGSVLINEIHGNFTSQSYAFPHSIYGNFGLWGPSMSDNKGRSGGGGACLFGGTPVDPNGTGIWNGDPELRQHGAGGNGATDPWNWDAYNDGEAGQNGYIAFYY